MGSTFDEPLIEDDEDEDIDKLRDDLESTKQLLDLEVRSKKLLEKDNKRMAQELERLKQEFAKMSGSGQSGFPEGSEDASKARRNSVAMKRNSVIRLLSESESHETQQEVQQILEDHYTLQQHNEQQLEDPEDQVAPPEIHKKEDDEPLVHKSEVKITEKETPPVVQPAATATPALRQPSESFYEEEIAEIEEMREEVDEARKLAEEWESKYKEMQRQMSELETSRYKKHSLVLDSGVVSGSSMQKKASVTSELEGSSTLALNQ